MIKAVIIDDEQHCIDRLALLLHEYCGESIAVEGVFRSVEDGIRGIKKIRPGVVFLDVQIQEKTGFDLVKGLKEITFDIIFTTAYEKYAVQAFRFSAVDYLLKPVDVDDLLQAVKKLEGKISKDETVKKIEVLLHNIRNVQEASKRINIPTVNGLIFLNVNEIIRCESQVNYTTIHLKDGQKYTVAKTLKEFEEMLSDSNFYRVHNSHLINLAHIKSYNKGKGGYVCMADNSEIEVSTRRKEDFLKRLA